MNIYIYIYMHIDRANGHGAFLTHIHPMYITHDSISSLHFPYGYMYIDHAKLRVMFNGTSDIGRM